MERTTHQLQAEDGIRISIDCYHDGANSDVVILCPGFFKSKETPTFQRMACSLAVGRDVICIDFRGHGRSGGRFTFSASENADLLAVLAFARQQYKRIGIVGFSLGGSIAINTLSRDRAQVHSLVTVGTPCLFEDIEFNIWAPGMFRRAIASIERGAGCRPGNLFLKKECPLDQIEKLAGLPVLIMHGENDNIVGVEHGRRLFERASNPKRLEIIPGGGHADVLFREETQLFCNLVEGWLTETLSVV